MTTIDERVAAGAKWLDEHRPGWWQRINLDTLDLGDPCKCVLGQEYGGYFKCEDLAQDDFYECDLAAADLGMFSFAELDGRPHRGEYSALTAAWRSLILARREAHGPCPPDCTCGGTYRPDVVDAEAKGGVL